MPGLRENLEASVKPDIRIDDEFATLIPPLSDDEFSRLEQSILQDGCRDAIIIWNGIIIDGHNRYRICSDHNIPFRTESLNFDSRDEAMLWMMQNQLARRNLNDFQRVEIVRKYESAVKAKAAQRMLAGKPIPTSNLAQGRSRDILANMAGVGHSTYERATTIIDNAPYEVKEAVRSQAISINAGYEATKLPPETQAEISHRIKEGENPRKVVAEAVKRTQRYSIAPKREDVRKALILSGINGISINEMFVKLIHEALSSNRYKKVFQGQEQKQDS